MSMNRIIAAALVAAALAVAAPASQAGTVTFTDFDSQIIGGATATLQPTLFDITNETGVTWGGFEGNSSPRGISYLNYSGPGTFTDEGFGSFKITGISIANLGVLSFAFESTPTGAPSSWTFSGNPVPAATSPIPLPAAAWMLLGGVGALGAVARKRKG